MIKTFFISDTHFSHKNIILFEPYYRPFKTIEEHDEVLIDRWNSVVNKNDIVWHLGDVIFSKDNMSMLSRLNGRKKLVLGNHDHYQTKAYLDYFEKLYGCIKWGKDTILSHIPISTQQFSSDRFKYNIHRHLHSKRVRCLYQPGTEIDDHRYINVSCEQIDCTPIEWKVLQERYMK